MLQIWMLVLTFQNPMVAISARKNDQELWVIDHIGTMSISGLLGLQETDYILKVNDIPTDEYWSVRYWGNLDQVHTLTISRNGNIMDVSVNNAPRLTANDVFFLAAEAIGLLLALILYKKMVHIKSSAILSMVFVDISLIFMSLPGSVRGDPLGKVLISTFIMLLPVCFLHFLMVFFAEKGVTVLKNQRSVIIKCYAVTLAISSLQLIYFTDSSVIFAAYTIFIPLTLLVGIIGMMVNFSFLAYVYFKYGNRKGNVSIVIKTVFVSLFLSFFPIILFSFVPQILFGHEWINSFYMSWFIFIFPLTFVYLLATRRLYDIDMIVRRSLFTLLLSVVPSLLFTGVVKLLSRETSAERLVLIFIIILIGITFLLYSLENITSRLEPALFPRKYRLQLALKKIARNLGSISSLREMKDVILGDIVETLEVMGGAIAYRYNDGSIQMILDGSIEQIEVESLILFDVPSQNHGDYMCFEVSRQEEYTSYLILTPKKTSTALGIEDLNWLNLIITYLAVSIENIHLIQKLNERLQQLSSLLPDEKEAKNLAWFRKLMFELQEKERIRIATDLHDTTMQDLFFLKGRLEDIQKEYVHFHELKKVFDSLMDYIDIINTNLRQSCFELHPYLLREVGLVGTLTRLFQTERSLCSFQISFAAADKSGIEEQNMETKRHLFRLVQELLNNAKKHSQASIVRFSICLHEGRMYFEYMDDGVGFEPSQAVIREIGSSGIGMEQMKSRILSLGGHYELQSAAGEGVRFQASFPVMQAGRYTAMS
jgi:two-component system sensor histidine kinase ComP